MGLPWWMLSGEGQRNSYVECVFRFFCFLQTFSRQTKIQIVNRPMFNLMHSAAGLAICLFCEMELLRSQAKFIYYLRIFGCTIDGWVRPFIVTSRRDVMLPPKCIWCGGMLPFRWTYQADWGRSGKTGSSTCTRVSLGGGCNFVPQKSRKWELIWWPVHITTLLIQCVPRAKKGVCHKGGHP